MHVREKRSLRERPAREPEIFAVTCGWLADDLWTSAEQQDARGHREIQEEDLLQLGHLEVIYDHLRHQKRQQDGERLAHRGARVVESGGRWGKKARDVATVGDQSRHMSTTRVDGLEFE
jgi:hypothetical protein